MVGRGGGAPRLPAGGGLSAEGEGRVGRGEDVCACVGVTPALQRRGSRRFPPCAVPRRALSLRGWTSGEKFGQSLTGVSRVRPLSTPSPSLCLQRGSRYQHLFLGSSWKASELGEAARGDFPRVR